MATCIDYPCCGHTDGLGCDYTPDTEFIYSHAGCDHEIADCWMYDRYPEDPDPDTCEHTDVSCYTRPRYGTWYECSYCECYMTPIVTVADEAYESTAVPGVTITIPVLTIRFERSNS